MIYYISQSSGEKLLQKKVCACRHIFRNLHHNVSPVEGLKNTSPNKTQNSVIRKRPQSIASHQLISFIMYELRIPDTPPSPLFPFLSFFFPPLGYQANLYTIYIKLKKRRSRDGPTSFFMKLKLTF